MILEAHEKGVVVKPVRVPVYEILIPALGIGHLPEFFIGDTEDPFLKCSRLDVIDFGRIERGGPAKVIPGDISVLDEQVRGYHQRVSREGRKTAVGRVSAGREM